MNQMQSRKIIALIEPFKDMMYRYALNVVKDPFEAEDVVQESIVKIWKKREAFLSIENKKSWCITIARNLAIDKLRARKKKQTSDITEHRDIKDDLPNPQQQLSQDDTLHRIKEVIATLPEHQRDIVLLRDVEGYSYQEIADTLEYTIDQVKVNLHRARKILRKKLLHIKSEVY